MNSWNLMERNRKRASITEVMEAEFKTDGTVVQSRLLDTFPFPFYVVVGNVRTLPQILADALRQWLEMIES